VDQKQRQKELQLLVKKLTRERRTQAKKIDILCNDIIGAQRQFIKRLDTISFTANFYESIVGASDLSGLLYTAGRLLKEEIPDAHIVFFIRQQDGFELHMAESEQEDATEKQHLENCFTPELMENICKSNKVCHLDDMVSLGLQVKPSRLRKISAATIPLGQLDWSPGFILIYRSSANKLGSEELNQISAIRPGLSRAIASCQAPCKSPG
jgi:hypothetical protein